MHATMLKGASSTPHGTTCTLHTDHRTHKQQKPAGKPSRKNAKSDGCMRSAQPLRRRKV